MATRSSSCAKRATISWLKSAAAPDGTLERQRVGDVLEGTVSSCTPSGAYVTLDAPFVDVFLRIESMGSDTYACDDEVMQAFQLLSRTEGIIPALESTHALVHGLKRARAMRKDEILVINLSGRGDKDVNQVQALLGAAPASR